MAKNKQGMRVRLSYGDYIPIKGNSAKRYISPSTGIEISNYEFRKKATRTTIRAPTNKTSKNSSKSTTKKVKFTNKPPKTIKGGKLAKVKSEARKKANRANYVDKVRRYTDRQNRIRGELGLPSMTYQEARSSPDFRFHYHNLTHSEDNSLRGLIHDALVEFDYRDEWADYLPGDTP